jgi:phosphohistidine swiveling domain-containing protein
MGGTESIEVSVVGKDVNLSDMERILANIKEISSFEGVSLAGRRCTWTSEDIHPSAFHPGNDVGVSLTDERHEGIQITFFADGITPPASLPYYAEGKKFIVIKGAKSCVDTVNLLSRMFEGVETPIFYIAETETRQLPEQMVEITRQSAEGQVTRYIITDSMTQTWTRNVYLPNNVPGLDMRSLTKRASELMKREDRTDALFRYGLFVEQTEAIARSVREEGRYSKEGQELFYGQAVAMLFSLMDAHFINVYNALREARIDCNRGVNGLSDVFAHAIDFAKKAQNPSLENALMSYVESFSMVGRFLTHDKIENPKARPVGTFQEEEKAYGETLLKILGLMWAQDFNPINAIESAFRNWEMADWRRSVQKSKKEGYLLGYAVNPGSAEGIAYVAESLQQVKGFPPEAVIIVPTAETQYIIPVLEAQKPVTAYITEHGGKTSHAATILRGQPFVTLFGVEGIMGKVRTGDKIEINVPCPELSDDPDMGCVKLQTAR